MIIILSLCIPCCLSSSPCSQPPPHITICALSPEQYQRDGPDRQCNRCYVSCSTPRRDLKNTDFIAAPGATKLNRHSCVFQQSCATTSTVMPSIQQSFTYVTSTKASSPSSPATFADYHKCAAKFATRPRRSSTAIQSSRSQRYCIQGGSGGPFVSASSVSKDSLSSQSSC